MENELIKMGIGFHSTALKVKVIFGCFNHELNSSYCCLIRNQEFAQHSGLAVALVNQASCGVHDYARSEAFQGSHYHVF